MKRDWATMRAKVDAEFGMCRICSESPADPAHIIPRSHVKAGDGEQADNCIPLCRAHHRAYDHHELDLTGYLTLDEQVMAVELAGGLVKALRRVAPLAYREMT